MLADIFYPLFTLKITDLSCFIDTKKSGALPPPPPGHLPGPPGGLAAFPIAPDAKKQWTHIFSGLFLLLYYLFRDR